MRKRLKIVSITTVFMLYCFFLSIYSGTVFSTPTFFSNTNTLENFVPVILTNGDNHAEQAESSNNFYHNIPRTPIKNSFNQFSFSSLAIIGVLNSSYTFTFYIFYSENLFIRFSKTNIIFPFHNFW